MVVALTAKSIVPLARQRVVEVADLYNRLCDSSHKIHRHRLPCREAETEGLARLAQSNK